MTSPHTGPKGAAQIALSFDGLSTGYNRHQALEDVTFQVGPGEIVGIMGPNGSGKSTLMKAALGLVKPWRGSVSVFGRPAASQRRLVGYMPDFFGVYDDMSVIEYLEFFAAAYRIDGPARRKICEQKLELVDMSFKRDAMVNQLSRGQTQRIGLARVLLIRSPRQHRKPPPAHL